MFRLIYVFFARIAKIFSFSYYYISSIDSSVVGSRAISKINKWTTSSRWILASSEYFFCYSIKLELVTLLRFFFRNHMVNDLWMLISNLIVPPFKNSSRSSSTYNFFGIFFRYLLRSVLISSKKHIQKNAPVDVQSLKILKATIKCTLKTNYLLWNS